MSQTLPRKIRTRRRHSASPGFPVWLWVPGIAGIVFLLVPVVGLASRIDLGDLAGVLSSQETQLALGLSLLTSVISALIATLIGFPLGYALATRNFAGQRIIRTLILLPLVLPPVVCGLALLYTFGRSAPLGAALDSIGLGLAFTTAAVVVAQVFVSLPFMVMSIETAVAARGQGYELAAAELGAAPGRVFWTVTVPLLRQGITTGAILCFARSLGEFGATLTFAGSMSGVTRTMPLYIYLVRESDPQSAVALSLLLILVALVIITISYRSPHAPRFSARRPEMTSTTAAHSAPTERSASAELSADSSGLHDTDSGRPKGVHLYAGESERGIDVALTLKTGVTTALVGRNGAGKSSIFQIMTGALNPDSGRFTVDGRTIVDVEAGIHTPIHDRGIVHLAQNPLLFPHLSVLDNVAFGLRAHGRSRADARVTAQEVLDSLAVGQFAARRIEELSGGQSARVALARALVVEPRLLLLDEPLAALDIDVRVETRQVLDSALKGRTALLITHDVEDVSILARHLVLIDEGAVTFNGVLGGIDLGGNFRGRNFLSSFLHHGPKSNSVQ